MLLQHTRRISVEDQSRQLVPAAAEQRRPDLCPRVACLQAAVGRVRENLTQQHLQTSSSRQRRSDLSAGVRQPRRPLLAAATVLRRSLQKRALPKGSGLCGSRCALQDIDASAVLAVFTLQAADTNIEEPS